MKKITLIVSAVCLALGVNAQIFSDNFDTYNSGDYLGVVGAPDWTTWSGGTGTAEDVQIGTAQANSGSNSIFFLGQTGGGPQDVVLEFDQLYQSGTIIYETAFYVNANKSAYFNFQATQVIGTTWAMNCNMSGGILTIDDGVSTDLAVGSYTDNTWFTLRIEANLSTGRWQAYIDGTCIGVWANSINSLASVDLFPLATSSFYVDDVMYDYIPYTASALNATVAGFDIGGNIAGLNVYPTVTINNTGTTTTITSMDVTVDYNGTPYVESLTGLNFTTGQSMDVVFTTAIPLVAGTISSTATVSNVNGGNDDDASDDDACLVANPIVPAPGKVVVGEEATGTWCQWCPRGAVFMDQYETDFGPYWAGIAVHNGDPMTNSVYDAGIGALIGGYPSSLVDRGPDVDPSAMSTDFYTRLQTPPTAFITNTAVFNAATRVLQVTVTADFQMAANDNYKLACVITEDGVTGGSGYAQSNAYSGGSNGVMGGYELLGNPVPASQMVYDHVARGIEPSFGGDAASFPATVNVGEQHSKTYSFTLDAGWNENNMHIIGMLIDPSGNIDNAGQNLFGDIAGVENVNAEAPVFNLYPNPATTIATVELVLENDADVQLRVLDMSGKEVASRDYGTISNSTIQMNTQNFESGVYLVEVTVNGQATTKRLIIQ